MRILIVSDAWYPQVNGVVRTLSTVTSNLRTMGNTVELVTPDRYRTVPLPTYKEIRLAVWPWNDMGRRIAAFQPCAIHIATEGPLGIAARKVCLTRGYPFTTSFHTKFPEYLHARTRFPTDWSYAFLRWFHGAAQRTMVATGSLRSELVAKGFKNLEIWSRGVDVELFHPQPKQETPDPRPHYLYVGRVAVEKNIEAFLGLPLDGTKLVVGDGPQLDQFRRRFPEVRFLGEMHGAELAAAYANADVFVFPSLTDTFGLVLLEALASGVPVAAYPVTGPNDVINGHPVGCLDKDLSRAIRGALDIDPAQCRKFAEARSWQASTEQFLNALQRLQPAGGFNAAQEKMSQEGGV